MCDVGVCMYSYTHPVILFLKTYFEEKKQSGGVNK